MLSKILKVSWISLQVLGKTWRDPVSVKDTHEAYKMDGDDLRGTHIVYMGSPEREEATFFCFLALRQKKVASPRYVLYLESTIVVLNIDCSSRDAIYLYVYVGPSHLAK